LEKWGTFATVAGAAAASLTGLLFVAVSIRTEVIARSQELRNRGAQTLALFVTALVITILLSIPGQSYRLLVAPNAVTSALLLVAGVLLIFNVHAGLDVLVLPVLAALGGGVTTAWLLLTKIRE
jgi:hypothetical protein